MLQGLQSQAMVEMALVLPLLLMLVFGIIQFGIVFNNYETVTDAARVGARKAAVSRLAPDPVAAATQAAKDAAGDLDPAKLTVAVSAAPWDSGAAVSVTVKYPYSIKLFGLPLKSGDLTSTTTERIE